MDWFLYNRDLRHEGVKPSRCCYSEFIPYHFLSISCLKVLNFFEFECQVFKYFKSFNFYQQTFMGLFHYFKKFFGDLFN